MKFSVSSASISGGSLALLSILTHVSAQGLPRAPLPPSQNVSVIIGPNTTCNASCQALVQTGYSFEFDSHAHTPLDDFYSIPAAFNTSLAPGTLIKVEAHTDLTNYTVPSGLSMSRIMYTSRSVEGTIVPVTAYVLWPYLPLEYTTKCWGIPSPVNKTGPAKFPLVAWAHGTSGQYSNCAPSNYRSLQYHFMVPYSVALDGFAVVATDYQGLGTKGPAHAWLASTAAADDVAFAIEAARKAFPDNLEQDGPFVTIGHSQGGNTAWAFAERQAHTPVVGYCGTTSLSPPARPVDWVNAGLKKLASVPLAMAPLWALTVFALQTKIIAAVTTAYPQYNASGMSSVAWDRWYNVIKPLQACLSTEGLVYADVDLATSAKPNWTQDASVIAWQKRFATAGKPVAAPMLLVLGDNDFYPIELLDVDVNATCSVAANANKSIEVSYYSGSEHFSVISASRPQWMKWAKDKVTNSTASRPDGVCGFKTPRVGFNSNYTVHLPAPNWLVTWASQATEGWKLIL